jgi:hypothetical protein
VNFETAKDEYSEEVQKIPCAAARGSAYDIAECGILRLVKEVLGSEEKGLSL